jgi:hypothetical protein
MIEKYYRRPWLINMPESHKKKKKREKSDYYMGKKECFSPWS